MALSEWEDSMITGTQRLHDLVDGLKLRGVREFKGTLHAPDGAVLWTLELTFEREKPAHKRDPLE